VFCWIVLPPHRWGGWAGDVSAARPRARANARSRDQLIAQMGSDVALFQESPPRSTMSRRASWPWIAATCRA
jgi:hypothetical protein